MTTAILTQLPMKIAEGFHQVDEAAQKIHSLLYQFLKLQISNAVKSGRLSLW
jgi:hypothetical protein